MEESRGDRAMLAVKSPSSPLPQRASRLDSSWSDVTMRSTHLRNTLYLVSTSGWHTRWSVFVAFG